MTKWWRFPYNNLSVALTAAIVAFFGSYNPRAIAAYGTLPQAGQATSQVAPAMSNRLAGAWVVTVSHPPNRAQLSSLGALVTFSSDKKRGSGAVIETEDDAFAAPAGMFGHGDGVCERTSASHYRYAVLIHQYDPSGNLIAIEWDATAVALDGNCDIFQCKAHFVVKDRSGNASWRIYTRDQWLNALEKSTAEINSLVEQPRIDIYPGTAVVAERFHVAYTAAGKQCAEDDRATYV